MLAAAEFSVYLRALLPLCALAKNNHSTLLLTEECCQVLIQSSKPLLTWGQEVLGNSAMAWDQSSGQPMTASVVKQCPKSMSIWWQKGEEQRDPCLQIKQAASLTALIGSDPFLRWTLDLHGITQIAETAGIKKQTEGLFFQHLYNELGQDFILQGRTESAQFENLLPVTLSHKGLAGEQWVRCDVLGSSVKASAV